MKAVVLGATGFIGSHIVRELLEEDIEVRVLRRATSSVLALKELKYEEAIGDLEDEDSLLKAFKGCHVLFHAAGYYPLYSFEREKQKNIALRQMKNVLEAAEQAKVRKIVYTSSMSTIGRSKNGKPSNEETPYDPAYFNGLYYEIKYLLEREVLEAAERGLPVTLVNPTGVFGDVDVKPTSGTLIVRIAKEKVPAIIDAPINAVDVRDVARGQIAAMKQGKVGRRYILGGHNTNVWEVSRLIAKVAGVPPPKMKLPLFIGKIAAPISEIIGKYFLHLKQPTVPRVGIDFLKFGMHYDIARAKAELGLKTTPMEETFKRGIDWFRKNGYV